jgi:hypothetical protein
MEVTRDNVGRPVGVFRETQYLFCFQLIDDDRAVGGDQDLAVVDRSQRLDDRLHGLGMDAVLRLFDQKNTPHIFQVRGYRQGEQSEGPVRNEPQWYAGAVCIVDYELAVPCMFDSSQYGILVSVS